MTTVRMLYRQGRPVGFDASGHTGYAQQGSDIVCSAVSAVTQTAVLGLTQVLGIQVGLDMEDGRLYCILGEECEGAQLEQAQVILCTMEAGLNAIKEEYGKFLKITKKEV